MQHVYLFVLMTFLRLYLLRLTHKMYSLLVFMYLVILSPSPDLHILNSTCIICLTYFPFHPELFFLYSFTCLPWHAECSWHFYLVLDSLLTFTCLTRHAECTWHVYLVVLNFLINLTCSTWHAEWLTFSHCHQEFFFHLPHHLCALTCSSSRDRLDMFSLTWVLWHI